MKITKELVDYVANLSRIRLSEEQGEKMQSELSAIVDYMDVLNTLDTEGVEPLSHVFAVTNVLREDVVCASYPREELLKNAPQKTDETVIVPKTMD